MFVANADFTTIVMNEHLGDQSNAFDGDQNVKAINEYFNYKGRESTTRFFWIDGIPLGDGYLLMQVYGVQAFRHQVLINGQDLPSTDIVAHKGDKNWILWNDRIPESYLRSGYNTIQFRARELNPNIDVAHQNIDDFLIRWVTIHWRERRDMLLWPPTGPIIRSG